MPLGRNGLLRANVMKHMPVYRSFLASLLCLVILPAVTPAQQVASAAAAESSPTAQQPRFVGEVKEVLAPVTVTDKDGNLVNGLQPYQFHLTDNGKDQDIHVDISFEPISMVVAVQANAGVEAILPQVRKIPELLSQFIVGEQGKAAIVAFDHRIQVLQPFTSDSTKIDEAVKKIHAGSFTSRMVDALGESIRLLSHEPKNRRRVVLLISETRDLGSEGKKREVIFSAEINNVEVYAVDMSRFVDVLSGKQKAPRPDPMITTARQGTLPANVPATPTTVAQTFGQNGGRAEFLPLFKEILKDVKDIFVDNPVELMTKGTGGKEYSFYSQHGLESALSDIGRELHSQYMITYTPNNGNEAGFHEIEVGVGVSGVRGIKARTRPGYWVAAKY
jgi:VWFA-related protein